MITNSQNSSIRVILLPLFQTQQSQNASSTSMRYGNFNHCNKNFLPSFMRLERFYLFEVCLIVEGDLGITRLFDARRRLFVFCNSQ